MPSPCIEAIELSRLSARLPVESALAVLRTPGLRRPASTVASVQPDPSNTQAHQAHPVDRSDEDEPHNTPNRALRNSSAANPQVETRSLRENSEAGAVTESVDTTTKSVRPNRSRLGSAIRRSPALNAGYRIGVAAAGTAVIGAGIAMLPLPGPGWAVIFVGLAILSTEFHWARRLTQRMRRVYERAKRSALDPQSRRRNQIFAVVAVVIAASVAGWYVWAFGLRLPL